MNYPDIFGNVSKPTKFEHVIYEPVPADGIGPVEHPSMSLHAMDRFRRCDIAGDFDLAILAVPRVGKSGVE
jgi:hypothetical protein